MATDGGLPGIADIRQAAARLEGRIRRTPLVRCDLASARTKSEVFLKLENQQRTGSFKPRGALSAALLAAEAGPVAGLITFSSGNHGQAVALAAEELAVPCLVIAPEDVRQSKRSAMERRGARVETCGLTSAERMARALERQRELGWTLIPPYDHPAIIAGQGTVGLEIAEEAPGFAAVFVPVGGGGLISGIATALAALRPSVRVIGVEPADADDARRSLAAGQLLRNERPSRSSCDGLRGTLLGHLNWEIVQRHVSEIVTVTDDEVEFATTLLVGASIEPIEPSGAAALAAVLQLRVGTPWERVIAIVSGGNAS